MILTGSAVALALAAAPVDPTAAPTLPVNDPVATAPVAPAAPVPAAPAQPAVQPVPAAPQPTRQPAPAPGDIVVSGRVAIPGDPLATVNAKSYEVIQGVDRAFVGPIAKVYEHGLPEPVRDGFSNFLTNLREPVVFVNYLLQLKPGKALRTVGRFAVNSTLGVAGVIDVAKRKPFNMPHKINGFADTFACYGIGSGPYLFLPLIGPTTLRDVIGVTLDHAFLPFVAGKPFNKPYYALPAAVIDTLDVRIDMDADLRRIREETNDPYAASRDLYLKQRYEHLMELCPRRAAKAFTLPSAVKAELKAEGTPVQVDRPAAPVAPPAPVPPRNGEGDHPQGGGGAPTPPPAPPQ